MANTKISALPAVVTVDAADEFAVNDAGVSKRLSITQLQAYLGRTMSKSLGTDITGINSNSSVKATNLDLAVPVGLWSFDYRIVYTSSTLTIGMGFHVNFTGTQTCFVAEGTQFESTTAASTGAVSQAHNAGFGLRSGGTARVPSNGVQLILATSVDAINADILIIIRGLMNVTVAGNLELYYRSEVLGGTQVLKSFSSLHAAKIG